MCCEGIRRRYELIMKKREYRNEKLVIHRITESCDNGVKTLEQLLQDFENRNKNYCRKFRKETSNKRK